METSTELTVFRASGDPLDMARSGDTDALNQLFAPCIPRLKKVAARLLRNEEDSEDAVQECLLSAYCHLDTFHGRAAFSTWLHSIVVNMAKMELRRRRARPLMSCLDEPVAGYEDLTYAGAVPDPRPPLDRQYERLEQLRILSNAIDLLRPACRTIMRMHYLEGLKLTEIAARLDLSVVAVKASCFRGSHLVRRTLRGFRQSQSPRHSATCGKRKLHRQDSSPAISDPLSISTAHSPYAHQRPARKAPKSSTVPVLKVPVQRSFSRGERATTAPTFAAASSTSKG